MSQAILLGAIPIISGYNIIYIYHSSKLYHSLCIISLLIAGTNHHSYISQLYVIVSCHSYISQLQLYHHNNLPSGNLTQLLKIAHLQLIYLLKMVIFHSYVSLPEGIYQWFFWGPMSQPMDVRRRSRLNHSKQMAPPTPTGLAKKRAGGARNPSGNPREGWVSCRVS